MTPLPNLIAENITYRLSATKPGSLLKSLISIRTFTERNEERPEFMEIDLVAHCGNTTEGQYLNTLTCMDICTGWTDATGLLNRLQGAASKAIQQMRRRLPFPCSASIRIMAVSSHSHLAQAQVSMRHCTATIWMGKSLFTRLRLRFAQEK